jgi:hypothetical protein
MCGLWKKIAIGLALASSFGLAAATRTSPARYRPTFDLRCLSPERMGCGCSLKITTLSCSASHTTGWKAHFASHLNDGAPLWMNLGGREFSIPSLVPPDTSFRHGRGQSWRDRYESDDVKVQIQYRPGKSTCNGDEESGDGCEYFDVTADVTVTMAGGASRTYQAIGACGC